MRKIQENIYRKEKWEQEIGWEMRKIEENIFRKEKRGQEIGWDAGASSETMTVTIMIIFLEIHKYRKTQIQTIIIVFYPDDQIGLGP